MAKRLGLVGRMETTGRFVQFDVEDIPIKKKDSADRLVLGRSRGNILLIDEIGDEGIELGDAHLARMALVMKQIYWRTQLM